MSGSAATTPQQRPVQHNPYLQMTPLNDPAKPTTSPPAMETSKLPTPPTRPVDRSSNNNSMANNNGFTVGVGTTGGSSANNPQATPQFGFNIAGLNSMYAATPQQGPHHPARMSPGPALGPNALQQTPPREHHMNHNQQHHQHQPQQHHHNQPPQHHHQSNGHHQNTNNGQEDDLYSGTRAGGNGIGSFGVSAGGNEPTQRVFGQTSSFFGGGGWGQEPPATRPTQDYENAFSTGGSSGLGWFTNLGNNASANSSGSPTASGNGYGSNGSGTAGGGNNINALTRTFAALQPERPPQQYHPYPSSNNAPPTVASGFGSHASRAYGNAQVGAGVFPSSNNNSPTNRFGTNGMRTSAPEFVPRGVPSNSAPAAAHTFLTGKLRYILLPGDVFVQNMSQRQQQNSLGLDDRPIQMYTGRGRAMQDVCPSADLFVAQLPFNMHLSALQFLFDAVAGISCDIMHAAPHYKRGRSYDGCAFVKVSVTVAQILIETFHKAALFDQAGVWVADTPEQRRVLGEYCSFMQEKSPQERRAMLQKPIPFSAMTVELANRSYSF